MPPRQSVQMRGHSFSKLSAYIHTNSIYEQLNTVQKTKFTKNFDCKILKTSDTEISKRFYSVGWLQTRHIRLVLFQREVTVKICILIRAKGTLRPKSFQAHIISYLTTNVHYKDVLEDGLDFITMFTF